MKIVKLPPINSLKSNMKLMSNQRKTRMAVINEPSVGSHVPSGLIGGGLIGAEIGGKIGGKIGSLIGAIAGAILGSFLDKEYIILWEHQIGDIVSEGEKIATLYEKKIIYSKDKTIVDRENTGTYMCWEVTSPTSGVLQGILVPSGQSVKGYSNVELALISTVPEPLDTVKIFYSFAPKDELLRKELEKHLSVLKREGFIASWHDGDITVGINQRLDSYLTAHIVLLLISPDFMDSDNCYSVGQVALQRHKRVIPVLLRPIDWKISSMAKLQALPTNARPITSWENLDEAFLNVALGIRKVIWDVIEAHLILLQSIIANDTILINSYKTKILALEEKIKEDESKLQKLSAETTRIRQQPELVQEKGIEKPLPTTQPEFPYELQIIQDIEGQVKMADPESFQIEVQRNYIESTQASLQKQLDRAKTIIQMCFDEQRQLITYEKETVELLSKINI